MAYGVMHVARSAQCGIWWEGSSNSVLSSYSGPLILGDTNHGRQTRGTLTSGAMELTVDCTSAAACL